MPDEKSNGAPRAGIGATDLKKIEKLLPIQRGSVKYDNLTFLNAVLHVAESGCSWRNLPKEYGNWNSIYMKASRWFKAGILAQIFRALQKERIASVKLESLFIGARQKERGAKPRPGAPKKTAARPAPKPASQSAPKPASRQVPKARAGAKAKAKPGATRGRR
jgi:transposase